MINSTKTHLTKKFSLIALILMMSFLSFPSTTLAADGDITFTGTITAMSGVSIPATLTVLAGATTYTVDVTSSTNIVRRFNGPSDLSEFMIGDTVEVRGTLSNDAANTVNATKIKNISIQRKGGTFHGSIVTPDCASNSFTYKPDKRSQQTVYVSSNTKIIRGGEKIACADLKPNERAIVIGVWRPSINRIDADRVIVNLKTLSGIITAIELTEGGLPATLTVKHGSGQIWKVTVTSSTKLLRRYMKNASIEEFAVGDKVEVRGTRTGELSINALMVRNNSITTKYRDFVSRIYSIDHDAATFVIKITRKEGTIDVTVSITSDTKIYDDGELIDHAALGVGTKVKILGEYNSSTHMMTATRIYVKD